MSSYLDYWGKKSSDGEILPLPYHQLDVAAIAWSMTKLHRPGLPSGTVAFLGALHDIGKFSFRFQKEEAQYGGKTDWYHTNLGMLLWNRELAQKTLLALHGEKPDRSTINSWRNVINSVIGHHGSPVSSLNEPLDKHFHDADIEAAVEYSKALINTLPHPNVNKITPQQSWIINGLLTLADWLGSSDQFTSPKEDQPSVQEYWERLQQKDYSELFKKIGLNHEVDLAREGFGELFGQFEPRPIQRYCDQVELEGEGSKLFVIEAATGSGKTEAALTLAQRLLSQGQARSLFFALPTTATSNAMAERLTAIRDRLFGHEPSFVLSHSRSKQAQLSFSQGDSQETDEGLWLAQNPKSALLSELGVGTVDQALLSVLKARHQSLRLFGLAGDILIVDEVHSYDHYLNRLLEKLITTHSALGGHTILLSATLTNKQRKRFYDAYQKGMGDESGGLKQSDFPLVTTASSEGVQEKGFDPQSSKTLSIRRIGKDEVCDTIKKHQKEGCSIAWIRNTVHDARAGYQDLQDDIEAEHLTLLHSRFTQGERNRKEQDLLRAFGPPDQNTKTREGKVVVATQVIEQSLDLDFDVMITDLAPADAIAQRAGRLQRHERERPLDETPLYVVAPETDSADGDWYEEFFFRAAYVYPDHGTLYRTARFLEKESKLTLPDQTRSFIETAYDYDDDDTPEGLQKRDQEAREEGRADKSTANLHLIDWPEEYGHRPAKWQGEAPPTRLGYDTTGLRFVIKEGDSIEPWGDAWTDGDLTVASYRVGDYQKSGNEKGLIEQARNKMPDQGRGKLVIPLSKDSGVYKVDGTIYSIDRETGERNEQALTYSKQEGLIVG